MTRQEREREVIVERQYVPVYRPRNYEYRYVDAERPVRRVLPPPPPPSPPRDDRERISIHIEDRRRESRDRGRYY